MLEGQVTSNKSNMQVENFDNTEEFAPVAVFL